MIGMRDPFNIFQLLPPLILPEERVPSLPMLQTFFIWMLRNSKKSQTLPVHTQTFHREFRFWHGRLFRLQKSEVGAVGGFEEKQLWQRALTETKNDDVPGGAAQALAAEADLLAGSRARQEIESMWNSWIHIDMLIYHLIWEFQTLMPMCILWLHVDLELEGL